MELIAIGSVHFDFKLCTFESKKNTFPGGGFLPPWVAGAQHSFILFD